MTEINPFQDLAGRLDLYLPWLLSSLETIEQLMPVSGRLLLCVPLAAWLALRHRQAVAHRRFARVLV